MKKIFVSLVIITAMIMTSVGPVFAASSAEAPELPDLKIIIDGRQIKCENTPILVQGNTLLPLREMAAILGVPNDEEHIIYNNNDKSVTILNGQTKIVVYIGKLDAFVNDEPVTLKVAPVIYGKGYTYVPFRFIAEALGKKVLWDGPAQTILICDAGKFDEIKGIITKSNEASQTISKCKLNMDITMDIYSETISAKVGMEINSAIDKVNKKMDMQTVMEMFGIQIKTQSYYVDNVSYTQVPLTQEWQKKVYPPAEYEMVFNQQSNYEIMQFEDSLCAGMNLAESEDENEILLAGDVLLMDMYNSLVKQQSLMQDLNREIVIETCSFEMALDKDTYLIKDLIMKMKLKQSTEYEDVTIDVEVNLAYSDYNGDFEIVVPEEVIESAVEVDLGETMLQ